MEKRNLESGELGVWGEGQEEREEGCPGFSLWLWAVGPFSESRMQAQKPSQMKKEVDSGYSDFYYYLLM